MSYDVDCKHLTVHYNVENDDFRCSVCNKATGDVLNDANRNSAMEMRAFWLRQMHVPEDEVQAYLQLDPINLDEEIDNVKAMEAIKDRNLLKAIKGRNPHKMELTSALQGIVAAGGVACPHCRAKLLIVGVIHGSYCNACRVNLPIGLAIIVNAAMDAAGVPDVKFPKPRVPAGHTKAAAEAEFERFIGIAGKLHRVDAPAVQMHCPWQFKFDDFGFAGDVVKLPAPGGSTNAIVAVVPKNDAVYRFFDVWFKAANAACRLIPQTAAFKRDFEIRLGDVVLRAAGGWLTQEAVKLTYPAALIEITIDSLKTGSGDLFWEAR